MPAILRSFDLALIPLKKLDLFRGALPSKMFEAMAAEVPIIASIEGEARELVERAQAGIAIQPENPEAMACCHPTTLSRSGTIDALWAERPAIRR